MRQLLRLAGRRQRFSTATAAAATASSSPPPLPSLPSRHSRKRIPDVCTDPVMLQELTQSVLEAPEGTLFTYGLDRDGAADAWDAADATRQKVEFLVRGYAAQLPGTMWQRWVLPDSPADNVDPTLVTEHFNTMEALLDRIWDEGHAYMTVRADRMQEKAERQLALQKGNAPDEEQALLQAGEIVQLEKEEEQFQLTAEEEKEFASAMEAFGGIEAVELVDEDDDDEHEENRPFMDDFALPGPSVNMFHTILDAMACHTDSQFVTIDQTRMFWNDILSRHEVDGGDLNNTQPHTAVSVLSYNAPIRIVAALPYKNNDVTTRDYGLLLAFEAYDALTHSQRCKRNAATFTYILQTVAKYMPASRNKGNVAAGIFYLAQEEGCVDKHVLEAYQLANTPSNGAEFDSWFAPSKVKGPGELPHAWRRNNKARRHEAREATY